MCVTCGLATSLLAAGFEAPREICRYSDPQLEEVSGITAASSSNDYWFVHNDSGDGPFVYAVSRRGETMCKFLVDGASAFDWEDIATGPDETGARCLFIGDIGDNDRVRHVVTIFRVPEPVVTATARGTRARTRRAQRFNLSYEGGPNNAETLLVQPKSGQVFIVTKSEKGHSLVFAAPQPLRSGTANRMRKIAEIRFDRLKHSKGRKGGKKDSYLATGGAIAPDGKHVVVRTYSDAYEWNVPDGNLATALARPPAAQVTMPDRRSGEAIAYSRGGQSLLVTNEGKQAPIFELARKR